MDLLITLAIIAALLLANAAFAHHGFGNFDTQKEIALEGTVTGIDFVNPHAYVYFDVVGADGAGHAADNGSMVSPHRAAKSSAFAAPCAAWTIRSATRSAIDKPPMPRAAASSCKRVASGAKSVKGS